MCTRIAIHGAAGRMGKRLIALGSQDARLRIVAAIESGRHPQLGEDAGALAGIDPIGVPLSDQCDQPVDVLIDFSTPPGAEHALQICSQRKIPLVMATTGLNDTLQQQIHQLARTVPVVWSPSMSTAVNLAMQLAVTAARTLQQHSSGVDVEVLERHHRFKEDAPSGTALKFGQLLAEALQLDHHVHGRQGHTGPRTRNEIGYHAIRTGDNPGEHTIVFGMLGETLELTVRASNRDCYATGALQAAKFVGSQPPKLYNMFDVLGLQI